MKGSYDFYTLVTCLMILALQIHNPFQPRDQSHCRCDGAASRPEQTRVAGPATSRGPQEAAEASTVSRRPREAAAAAASASGLSTDALLRELDSIQGRAKEQQEVLAAAGRMPPPSPILQQLKEAEAGMPSQAAIPARAAPVQHVPQAPMQMQAAPAVPATAGDGSLIRRRDDLGRFLQAEMPRGLGVILGVGRGDFALRLLRDWSSAQGLYLVDPYIHQWRGYDDPANLQDTEHQMIFEELRNRLEPFEGRYVLVRDFSHSFAEIYRRGDQTPNVATFVYIDANHAEDAVSRDLELWWPVLASGGLLAGSSYVDDASGRVRVRSAVDRFAAQRQLQVITTQDDMPPSWFIVKP
eukprot:TRINITY_DN41227_c0_g1_i1.p1 TRINITY_DN41227_c0_g1~~TRINITY_DN41227_c0_g1_i1.p1  ORF type:complete len:354 (-),score=49.96 TRINITY_DN41227_c0_g1_i1:34-1095(-)